MAKVKITQRSVYHKIAVVEVDIPNDIKDDEVLDYLINNEPLYTDKVDQGIADAKYEFGLGLGDGMNETENESEWRYDIVGKNYGGHI
mgnify:CR=1 FL=1|tara:strand:- start:44 stop:307 length:264 start_codon:yes stop_codon:yes gene_type:complete